MKPFSGLLLAVAIALAGLVLVAEDNCIVNVPLPYWLRLLPDENQLAILAVLQDYGVCQSDDLLVFASEEFGYKPLIGPLTLDPGIYIFSVTGEKPRTVGYDLTLDAEWLSSGCERGSMDNWFDIGESKIMRVKNSCQLYIDITAFASWQLSIEQVADGE